MYVLLSPFLHPHNQISLISLDFCPPSVSVYGASCTLMSLTETAYALLIFTYLGKGSLRLVLSLSLCILKLDNDPSDDPRQ